MARKKPAPGAVVKIPIDERTHTYGRVLKHPFIAVYDCRTEDEPDSMERITGSKVLFVVAVMDRAVQSGRWPVTGQVPLGEGEIPIPDQFMQDMFNPQKCRIIDADGNSRNATVEECVGLERAAVWEAEHVEERIRDHYAGRPNRHLEAMRLIR